MESKVFFIKMEINTYGFKFWFASPSSDGFTETNGGSFNWFSGVLPCEIFHVG